MVLNAAERAVWRSMRERNQVVAMALGLASKSIQQLANVNAGGALCVTSLCQLQDQLLELAHRWEQVTKNDDRDPTPTDEVKLEARMSNFKALAGMLMSYADRSARMLAEAMRSGGTVDNLTDLSERQKRPLASIKGLKRTCEK